MRESLWLNALGPIAPPGGILFLLRKLIMYNLMFYNIKIIGLFILKFQKKICNFAVSIICGLPARGRF